MQSDDVESLHRNCLSGWPFEQLREEVTRNIAAATGGERFHFVAVVGKDEDNRGEVIGTAYLKPKTHPLQRHRAEVVMVVVYPPFQRRGVARQLIAAAREQAAALDCTILEIACRGGEPAETAYTRIGFREYGRLPGGYVQANGQVFDQVLLWMPVRAMQAVPAGSAASISIGSSDARTGLSSTASAVQTEIIVVESADLTEAQRPAKQRLQESCFSAVPLEELMEDFVAESFATVLAYRAGELVGCVSVFKRPIVYEGRAILLGGFGGTCTRADVRRQGIGTRVCRAAYQLLWEEGCDLAFLAAAPGTEHFYGQFGFTPLGRVGYENAVTQAATRSYSCSRPPSRSRRPTAPTLSGRWTGGPSGGCNLSAR
ncbi:MAG TPA: GNAT family N-acetyltransferase [Chloroflexota bacterium]|nr:GNAT family N-acetyltransferase [Chloroflexota bacterium]